MSQQRIDIDTFVKKVIEKTDKNECKWTVTSTNDKYQLTLNNGALTIEHAVGDNWGGEFYKLDVSDSSGSVFATYYGDSENNENYSLLQKLFLSVADYFKRLQEEKLAKLFEELI
jgi:hypothetical protein